MQQSIRGVQQQVPIACSSISSTFNRFQQICCIVSADVPIVQRLLCTCGADVMYSIVWFFVFIYCNPLNMSSLCCVLAFDKILSAS